MALRIEAIILCGRAIEHPSTRRVIGLEGMFETLIGPAPQKQPMLLVYVAFADVRARTDLTLHLRCTPLGSFEEEEVRWWPVALDAHDDARVPVSLTLAIANLELEHHGEYRFVVRHKGTVLGQKTLFFLGSL